MTASEGVACCTTTYDIEEVNLSVSRLDLATPGDDDVRVKDLAFAAAVAPKTKMHGHLAQGSCRHGGDRGALDIGEQLGGTCTV